MSMKYLGLQMRVLVLLFFVITIGIVTQGAHADVVTIEDAMISPSELENGYWVQVYREYIDRNNEYWEPLLDDYDYFQEDLGYYHYAVLVDLDFDGDPEAVAIKETIKRWYITAEVIDIDRDGVCTVSEIDGLYWDSAISLYIDNGNPIWIEYHENSYKGDESKVYNRFLYSKSTGVSIEPWLEEFSTYDYWGIDNPQNTDYTRMYYINGEEVSYEDYRKENIIRKKMNYIVTIQLCNYSYPDDWKTACEQFSILRK